MEPKITPAISEKFKDLLRQPKEILVSLIFVGVASISLFASLLFVLLNSNQLSRTDISPQDGQLLNNQSIEKASQLLIEQTVSFNLEE